MSVLGTRTPDQISRRIHQERADRHDAQRDRFRAYYAEWLRLRAEDYDATREDEDDAAATLRGDRIDELARLITTTPAVLPYMIWMKLEVLEKALGAEDGTSWSDNREVVMLAGIKADLQRFNPGEPRT